ncbi:brix domain-containing protein [Haematococcus lacustris]|uniref:Brix domain-containing protein n=1 Tax=Haematococcus lacustris TaxID=44745 RepID=A0A699YKY1_HAELA|nr:brix domain-containing protein [Haematococcus lacustris]
MVKHNKKQRGKGGVGVAAAASAEAPPIQSAMVATTAVTAAPAPSSTVAFKNKEKTKRVRRSQTFIHAQFSLGGCRSGCSAQAWVSALWRTRATMVKHNKKQRGKGGVGLAAAASAEAPPIQSAMVAATAVTAAPAPSSTVAFKNKEKVLVLSTRGITFRYRHLMTDLIALIPHSKKDSKLDTKTDRNVINEVADMKSCTSVVFFEVHKRMDLYLWFAKTPEGPSVKFHVANSPAGCASGSGTLPGTAAASATAGLAAGGGWRQQPQGPYPPGRHLAVSRCRQIAGRTPRRSCAQQ